VSLRLVQQKVMHCRHDPSLRGVKEFGLLRQPILGRLSKVAVVLENNGVSTNCWQEQVRIVWLVTSWAKLWVIGVDNRKIGIGCS
jgi:hypothetical protein